MNANKRRGTAFETSIANYLAVELQDDRIERRAQSGAWAPSEPLVIADPGATA